LDGAAKWFSKDLTNFFKNKGIVTEVSTPYTTHQNGIAEKANYLVKEKVRVMLIKT
jgi:transposase InsO family protein